MSRRFWMRQNPKSTSLESTVWAVSFKRTFPSDPNSVTGSGISVSSLGLYILFMFQVTYYRMVI
jgi:hypothetical protein